MRGEVRGCRVCRKQLRLLLLHVAREGGNWRGLHSSGRTEAATAAPGKGCGVGERCPPVGSSGATMASMDGWCLQRLEPWQ